jgi:hypothetical protein
MSDEPKKRRKWVSRSLAAIVVLASYEATHYATVGWISDAHRVGHLIQNKPLPQWLEPLFLPAYQLDEMIGYSPPRPNFNPARPVALAMDR